MQADNTTKSIWNEVISARIYIHFETAQVVTTLDCLKNRSHCCVSPKFRSALLLILLCWYLWVWILKMIGCAYGPKIAPTVVFEVGVFKFRNCDPMPLTAMVHCAHQAVSSRRPSLEYLKYVLMGDIGAWGEGRLWIFLLFLLSFCTPRGVPPSPTMESIQFSLCSGSSHFTHSPFLSLWVVVFCLNTSLTWTHPPEGPIKGKKTQCESA